MDQSADDTSLPRTEVSGNADGTARSNQTVTLLLASLATSARTGGSIHDAPPGR
jgi:hypothetical protein